MLLPDRQQGAQQRVIEQSYRQPVRQPTRTTMLPDRQAGLGQRVVEQGYRPRPTAPASGGSYGGTSNVRAAPAPVGGMAPPGGAAAAFNGEDVMRLLAQIGNLVRGGVATAQEVFGQLPQVTGPGVDALRQGGALPQQPAQPWFQIPDWLKQWQGGG
jgi:hypothetical protein